MTEQRHLYQIRIEGQLDRCWSDWFDGMSLTYQPSDDSPIRKSGQTILTGYVIDQPALHGMLNKIRDLNLPVISVTRLQKDEA
ncbi:MAG: hypothetical protein U0175_06165 [Caldilineaceae bacterium]